MPVKSDSWITRMCREHGMIEPFLPELLRNVDGRRIISAGASSYGYDIRLSAEHGFKIFSPVYAGIVDPKHFDERTLLDAPIYKDDDGSKFFLMPPHSYALGLTMEYFRIPRDVLGLCHGKSTYARCGVIVNTTPLEPEWVGHLVLEFSNSSSTSVRIYAEEGVSQVIFLEGSEVCTTSYADRAGKYQDQRKIVSAKL
jgi:dCTP deaminase